MHLRKKRGNDQGVFRSVFFFYYMCVDAMIGLRVSSSGPPAQKSIRSHRLVRSFVGSFVRSLVRSFVSFVSLVSLVSFVPFVRSVRSLFLDTLKHTNRQHRSIHPSIHPSIASEHTRLQIVARASSSIHSFGRSRRSSAKRTHLPSLSARGSPASPASLPMERMRQSRRGLSRKTAGQAHRSQRNG